MPLVLDMVVPARISTLRAAVAGLVLINEAILAELADMPAMPRLYESAIRYRRPGKRRWNTIADLYDLLQGDCKDLAAARVAELRYFDGEHAEPHVYLTGRKHRYHAVVRRENGMIEDPSLILRDLEAAQTGQVEIIR